MYEIFKEREVKVPYAKLKDLYSGKWLLLANLQKVYIENEEGEFIRYDDNLCEVIVIADEPYEGSNSGIYREIYDNKNKFGITGAKDLRFLIPNNTIQAVIKDGVIVDND